MTRAKDLCQHDAQKITSGLAFSIGISTATSSERAGTENETAVTVLYRTRIHWI